MTSRLADLARRPGTVISCRRMVAVVALAWKTEAMVPAAWVRLNAIAAMTSQAALDANWPEVIWSRPTDVHDVGDEGCCPSGSRGGCGYLASSITTTEGCRCGFNAFSCRAQEQSPCLL